MKILITIALIFALGVGFVLGASVPMYQGTSSANGDISGGIPGIPRPTVGALPIELDSSEIEELVNDYREEYGLNRLTTNDALCEYANKRVPQLRIDWNHLPEDEFAKDPILSSFTYIGENLAKDYDTEKELVEGWILSPTHLKNIVDFNYNQTCLVVYDNNAAIQIFSN